MADTSDEKYWVCLLESSKAIVLGRGVGNEVKPNGLLRLLERQQVFNEHKRVSQGEAVYGLQSFPQGSPQKKR